MDTNISASSKFHDDFDLAVRSIMEPVRDTMIDSVPDTGLALSDNSVIAQVLMNLLAGSDESEFGKLDGPMKVRLVEMADWMGPDWAQALYHAAVFITKVA